MEIKLGKNHYLICDPYCYWIEVEYKTKTGKTARKRVSGYLRTFNEAIESCIEQKIRESESTTLTNLKKEIDQLKKEVRSWKASLPKK